MSAYAALLQVELEDGTTANAFCIQRYIPTTFGNTYVTQAWSDQTTSLGASSIGPIRWILDNAPPLLPISDLETAAGTALTPNEAYAAIQAAIWHFSDGVNLDSGAPTTPAIVMAYDYLVAQATANSSYTPDDPAIGLTPPSVPGEAGGLIGPFTINANPGSLAVSAALAPGAPTGAQITDSSGNPVAGPFTDGDELYLSIPEDASAGSTEIVVSALANRRDLMLMPDTPPDSQRLLLASTVAATIDAEATGYWVAKRSDSTPQSPTTPGDTSGTSGTDNTPRTTKPGAKRNARLSIKKRANRRSVRPGQTIRYRLVVRNRGNGPARGVRICDRLPGNVTVVSRGGGTFARGLVCWRVSRLAPGRKLTRSIKVRVDRDARPGRLVNNATVKMRRGAGDRARTTVKVLSRPRPAVVEGLVTG